MYRNKFLCTLCLGLLSLSTFAQKAGSPEAQLKKLQLQLPPVEKPVANYIKYVRSSNLIFLSGHIPCGPATENNKGKLGKELTVEQGYAAARQTTLCLLATLKDAVGDLSKVKGIVKVLGMVNSAETFTDQPKVMNGCSDLLVELFGDKGRHARSAVGMAALPGNSSVEIEMIVEIEN